MATSIRSRTSPLEFRGRHPNRAPPWSQSAPRTDVKFPILGFLMDGEATGYDLRRRFYAPVGFYYRISDGSLYPALKKLALDGLVTMRSESRGRRARKVYAITPQGRERFLRMLREPAQPVYVFDEAQVKIYFGEHDPTAAMELLEWAVKEDAARVVMLTPIVESMRSRGESPYRRLVVELGLAINQAKTKALARLREELERELKFSRGHRKHARSFSRPPRSRQGREASR